MPILCPNHAKQLATSSRNLQTPWWATSKFNYRRKLEPDEVIWLEQTGPIPVDENSRLCFACRNTKLGASPSEYDSWSAESILHILDPNTRKRSYCGINIIRYDNIDWASNWAVDLCKKCERCRESRAKRYITRRHFEFILDYVDPRDEILANDYGLTQARILEVFNRKTWTWIDTKRDYRECFVRSIPVTSSGHEEINATTTSSERSQRDELRRIDGRGKTTARRGS